jgi:hypothetical protein
MSEDSKLHTRRRENLKSHNSQDKLPISHTARNTFLPEQNTEQWILEKEKQMNN